MTRTNYLKKGSGSYFRYCTECGKSFPIDYLYRKTHLCSKECVAAENARRFSKQVECVCKECGATFTTAPNRLESGRGVYCSKECLYAREHSEDERNRIRESLKAHIAKNPEAFSQHCKDAVAVCWSKPENHEALSNTLRGKRGKNSRAYKNGHATWLNNVRTSEKMKLWTRAVLMRDYFTCAFTGKKGVMVAHHIVQFKDIIKDFCITSFEEAMACEALWDTGNGITMSANFHKQFHATYGK